MENEKEGFPITALREVKILKLVNHPNIVKLHDVIASIDKPNFYMIFEYVDHDLAGLMDSKIDFKIEHLKYLMKQLLEGVTALHSNGIIHRDLKSSNLLISKDGNLKIADFGLAKIMRGVRHTSTVVTRWYRAPEILLGDSQYTCAIDMWSVGCILGEVLKKEPIFRGKDELDQMNLIYNVCGYESWQGCENLTNWSKFKPQKEFPRNIKKFFSKVDPDALDLLEKLLQLDPKKRLTAKEALNHPWIKSGQTLNPQNILPENNCNELSAKKRRKRLQNEYPPGQNIKMRRIDNSRSHYSNYRPNPGNHSRNMSSRHQTYYLNTKEYSNGSRNYSQYK